MTIRQLAQILLSTQDLDKEVKISYRGDVGNDITSIRLGIGNNLYIGTSGFNQDKLTVRTEIEVKSPHSKAPKIF